MNYMIEKLKRLDKKKILLHVKFELNYRELSEDMIELNHLEDMETYIFKRNMCISQLDEVNNSIAAIIREKYDYSSLDLADKIRVNNLIKKHLVDLEKCANERLREEKENFKKR